MAHINTSPNYPIVDRLPSLAGRALRSVIYEHYGLILVLKSERTWLEIADYLKSKGVRLNRTSKEISVASLRQYWCSASKSMLDPELVKKIEAAKEKRASSICIAAIQDIWQARPGPRSEDLISDMTPSEKSESQFFQKNSNAPIEKLEVESVHSDEQQINKKLIRQIPQQQQFKPGQVVLVKSNN